MSGVHSRTKPCPALEVVAKGRILTARLVNPPDNRLTPEMVLALADALSRFESDDLDVLVITGSKRVFCKGFDIGALKARTEAAELRLLLETANDILTRIAHSPKMTLAAINGACLGAGLELAMACQLRVCADQTRLGLPEVWMNLIPGLGGFYRLARLVGSAKALELVAVGDLISAEEALRLNLVNRVLPRADFPEHVASFVASLTATSPEVLRQVLRLTSCSAHGGEGDNIRQATESFVELWPCVPNRKD